LSINNRATIKQVAKLAGVSTQTVSRVINDRPDVAPETRERIRHIIDELDYQPSALARSLIQQRSFTLGVVTAGLKYIGPSLTLNGITTQAEELGYALLLEELLRFDTAPIKPILQNLLTRHVDGIIWAVPEVGNNRRWVEETIKDLPVPVVFLDMASRPGISTVSLDNEEGGLLATRHLLEQGRRRIGHISGPLDWWAARERKQAWQRTMEEAGIAVKDNHWVEGNWSSSSGEAACGRLLRSYPEMDAVFVANDQMALSVLRAAHRQSLHVPQDLAVVGFDNLPESAYFWPSLTSIHQNLHRLGRLATEVLADQVEAMQHQRDIQPQNILLSPELIIRESSTI